MLGGREDSLVSERNTPGYLNRIEAWRDLPSLPHILLRSIEILNEKGTTLKAISQIINKDPALSARIMRMANSFPENPNIRVKDMEQALYHLETDTVRRIVLDASVSQAFSREEVEPAFRLDLFWRHSMGCAILSRLIAGKVFFPYPEEAYLSGLLHDIGKLIFWVHFKREYTGILNAAKEQADMILAEEEHLGITHCEAGAWLLHRANWNSFMADAILYHHQGPDRIRDALPLIKIVYLANQLCPETNQEETTKRALARDLFGFEGSEIEEISRQSQREVSEIAQSFAIDITPEDASGHGVSERNYIRQQDLVHRIKEGSLLLGTLQSLLKAYDEESILGISREGFRILFDAHQVVFFLYDSDKDVLTGKGIAAGAENSIINELTIPCHRTESLLAMTLRQGKPFHSFGPPQTAPSALVDEQIIRLIGKEGIFCLPLLANNDPLGVVCLGVDKEGFPALLKREGLLMTFCGQAASALHTNRLRQKEKRPFDPERIDTSSFMTRKVLHNVNTPLNVIKNYLTILGRKLDGENGVQEELRIIEEEIGRVALIIREVSEFSEPEAQQTEPLDINTLLSDFVRIFRESLLTGPNIRFHLNLDSSLPPILAKKNSLKQVFINLFENAVEAMPGGGNIHIHTRLVPSEPDNKAEKGRSNAHGLLEVIVRDDGPGIPDAIKPRLFHPLVTSKGEGHAGLGLSIVHDALKELNGKIRFESGVKGGTAFQITLPVRG